MPEVTFCNERIAKRSSAPQHVGMREFLLRLRDPMTLAGVFTLAAVALSLQFVSKPMLTPAVLLLSLFSGLYLLLAAGPEHWHRRRYIALLLMPLIPLLLAWIMPRIGTAQVLLVIWAACTFSMWSVRQAIVAVLLVNAAFYLLIKTSDYGSPLTMVIINLGFQALAGMCVYHALTAERSRDKLALVNADLLATRALLADSARDAERLRVARELHDVAGHKLTTMKLNLRALAADPVLGQRSEVLIAQQLSSELLDDIRNVVQALRDTRGLDMQTALRALAAPMPRPALKLEIDGEVHVSDPLVAETILRIVQEAMTNSARHADADTLHVVLRHHGDQILLDIEDDGRMRGAMCEGNGLAGMRERVVAADGELRLGKSTSGSLHLHVSLPA